MAARGAILTARSYVEVFADLDKLRVGLKSGERLVANFARSIGDIGRELMKASAVLAAPQALAIKTFGEFEKLMSRVKALTKATDEQFEALSRRAQDLGKATVYTAGDAADAMSVFALAGFKVDEILKAAGPALDLAAAGQVGIAEAADIAAKIMAGMGLSADDLSNSVDVLAKAMSTANTDISMLGQAFKFVGPVSKMARISLEEITAAIQLLSNAGIQGEMAGTTLRGMIMTLGSPTEKAREKLHELGVEVKDTEGRIRTLADIIGQFEKAMAGMENGTRLDILGQIFPDRQAAGGIELIAQGSQKLRDYTAALQDAGGTAEFIANTQLDNLWGRLERIQSAAEAVAITFGSQLQPVLKSLQDELVDLINGFDTWLQRNPQATQQLAVLTAGLFATGSAMVAAKVALMGLSKAIGSAANFVGSPWKVGISAILVLTGALEVALQAIQRAVNDLKGVWAEAWKGIEDSVKSGNLERATEIAFLTIKVTVLRIMQELRHEFTATFEVIEFAARRLEEVVAFFKEAASFIQDAGVVITGGELKYDPKSKSFYGGQGPAPLSDAVLNAETQLRLLLDEEKKKQAAQASPMAPAPAPAVPAVPTLTPPQAAASMSATFAASQNLTPLGQFEKGTDSGLQLVLDALGQGGKDTLANIYEEMKTVAANTEKQVELTRNANATPRNNMTIAVAQRRS